MEELFRYGDIGVFWSQLLFNNSHSNLKYMKHIAAFALLVLSGKENPTAADVEKLLKDAGIKAD